tara:strand:- start:257 stop:550 length:294 start_codon:yes stop_codon:yes gene_type:complete
MMTRRSLVVLAVQDLNLLENQAQLEMHLLLVPNQALAAHPVLQLLSQALAQAVLVLMQTKDRQALQVLLPNHHLDHPAPYLTQVAHLLLVEVDVYST